MESKEPERQANLALLASLEQSCNAANMLPAPGIFERHLQVKYFRLLEGAEKYYSDIGRDSPRLLNQSSMNKIPACLSIHVCQNMSLDIPRSCQDIFHQFKQFSTQFDDGLTAMSKHIYAFFD